MEIRQDKILIRNAEEKDAEILFLWWNDGKIMAHAGFENGLNISLEKIKDQIKNDYSCNHLMIDYMNKPIGEMSYRISNNIADIGIKICDTKYQDKGFGTKVLMMLIYYLFNMLKVDKIKLDTMLDNLRSQHVYEKVGFIKVKENIDAWVNPMGKKYSYVDYELERSRFDELYRCN